MTEGGDAWQVLAWWPPNGRAIQVNGPRENRRILAGPDQGAEPVTAALSEAKQRGSEQRGQKSRNVSPGKKLLKRVAEGQ